MVTRYIAKVHDDGDIEICRSAMSRQAAEMQGYAAFNDVSSITAELGEYGVEHEAARVALKEVLKSEINEWVRV